MKDHLLIAAPLLEERGWRGTFNLVTDWVGKDERHLTWDDVRELVRRGHEVATHTKTHTDLVKLLAKQGEAAVRRELAESRDAIADATGFTPRYMCSPFMQQNDDTARLCREECLRQMMACRMNFGKGAEGLTRQRIESCIANGMLRLDVLHHGISAEDRGGWHPFRDRAAFKQHLDDIAALEREGKIVVTDYDGMASGCKLKAKSWPRHGILSLSFDDTSFDQWEAALPLFAKHGARTTFFVNGTNRIDFMRKALDAGHEIGLHGFNHMDATETVEEHGEDWFWRTDIAPQLDALAAAGIPVRSYAYPNCCRTARTDEMFFSRGFSRVRGRDPAIPNPNPYDPQGASLDQWRPVAETDWLFIPAANFLKARVVPNVIMGESYHTDIEDILRAIERAGVRGEALFVVSHGIAPDAKDISMKTEWLERILSSADDSGVLVRGIR